MLGRKIEPSQQRYIKNSLSVRRTSQSTLPVDRDCKILKTAIQQVLICKILFLINLNTHISDIHIDTPKFDSIIL